MPGVLPNAVAIDAHLTMSHVHQRLYLQALYDGGACTKKFRQGSDDTGKGVGSVYHLRHTAGHRWGGVCKALSVYWIANHANDTDFWSWLFANNGQVDVMNAARVCDLQGAYSSDVPYAGGIRTRAAALETKFQFMKRVLAPVGLVERKTAFDRTLSVHGRGFTNHHSRTLRGREIASVLAPDYLMGQAMYKQLSFRGRRGAHATAAWIAQDVMFFDPNFGEFWFEHVADFRRWFEFFWRVTGYGSAFDDNFTIHCFGKSINHF